MDSIISRNSNFQSTNQFRPLVHASPVAVSTPAPSKTSFANKLLSVAQNFAPSILTNSWSTKSIVVNSTPNGSGVADGQRKTNRVDGPKHILGLDAYLSNDEDEGSDDDKELNDGRRNAVHAKSNLSSSTTSVHPEEAKKRPRESIFDGVDFFVDSKRRKLSADIASCSNSRDTSKTPRQAHISSHSRRRFWESNHAKPAIRHKQIPSISTPSYFQPMSHAGQTTYPAPSPKPSSNGSSLLFSGQTAYPEPSQNGPRALFSRPPSQAARYTDSRHDTNLFSIPPKESSISGRATTSRTSSALSHSRPSSVISNHASTPGYDFGVPAAYTSETRRILKEMDRAAKILCTGAHRLASSSRSVVNGPVANSVGKDATAYEAACASDNAQNVSRLATLGSSILQRSSKDYSRMMERPLNNGPNKSRTASVVPRSIVSSATVFRFAKPFPVGSGDSGEKNTKNHCAPPIVRFGNSFAPTLPKTTAAATAASGAPAVAGHVHFDLSSHRIRNSDGTFK